MASTVAGRRCQIIATNNRKHDFIMGLGNEHPAMGAEIKAGYKAMEGFEKNVKALPKKSALFFSQDEAGGTLAKP